jgi:hypothetical protein
MMWYVGDRSYNPEQVAVMGLAFERASGSLSSLPDGNNNDVREMLARIVLWRFDLGVRDPVRLSELALDDLVAGAWRSPDRNRGGVGQKVAL